MSHEKLMLLAPIYHIAGKFEFVRLALKSATINMAICDLCFISACTLYIVELNLAVHIAKCQI